MTDTAKPKGNKGVYTAKPITVTFPADCANADLAGKTKTYAGRGRKPCWWEFAVQLGLVASKEDKDEAPAASTDTPAADSAQA